MFNFGKLFQYLNIGTAVLAVVAAAGNPSNIGDVVTLLSRIGTTVSPSLANDKNFQTIQQILTTVANAEATGQPGQVASIPFFSHGNNLKITVSVEKA
jgi:hypothetical protein